MKKTALIISCLLFNIAFCQGEYRNFITKTKVSQTDTIKKEGLALVLANNEYQNILPLDYSVSDADTIVKSLNAKGIDIEVGYNLNKRQTLEAISDFSKRLKGYKYAIVYYSGHGVQKNGENFLIPIDANGKEEWEFDATTINLKEIFKELEDFDKPKFVVLDACRNNPFEDLKSMVKGKGLALVKALSNSITLFATAPDTAVKDTNQFSEILSKQIEKGGCIRDIIDRTGVAVQNKYPNQLIWPQGFLRGNICFGDEIIGTSVDSDGDGVVDSIDKCPNDFGPVSSYGCPKSYNFTLNRNLKLEELREYLNSPNNIEVLEKEAQSDNQFALYNLGNAYLKSVGSYEFNFKKAVEYFERSAAFGNSWAENNLGYIYECGIGSTGSSYYGDRVSTENDELAIEWFKKSAEKNNPVAYYNLAKMYQKGYGTEADFDEAKKWYIKAGHTGNPEAHYILGKHYFDDEDWEEALKWLNESIAKDDFIYYANVNYMIGYIYFFGLDVAKNYKLAYRYIKTAKDLKYKYAYYLYGAFYEYGLEVSRDIETANRWYTKGCDEYDNRACKKIGKFGSSAGFRSSWSSCNTKSN